MPSNPVDYVEHVALRMKTAHRIVQESLDCTFGRAKQRYDARVKPLKFTIWDLVWYFCPRRRPRLSPKWQLLTTGPWRVIKAVNLMNVAIQKVNGQKKLVANVDLLQRYVDGDPSGETGTLTGAQTSTLTGAQADTRTGILDTGQNELNSFQADVMEPRTRPRRKSHPPRRFVDGSFLRPVDRSPFSHELSETVDHCRFVRMVFHCPS